MQFNRKEYLNDNYDTTIQQEVRARYKAVQIQGLEWNMYISDYVLYCLRSEFMKVDVKVLQPVFALIPLLSLGMFNSVASMLENSQYEDPILQEFAKHWAPLLRTANDIDEEE